MNKIIIPSVAVMASLMGGCATSSHKDFSFEQASQRREYVPLEQTLSGTTQHSELVAPQRPKGTFKPTILSHANSFDLYSSAQNGQLKNQTKPLMPVVSSQPFKGEHDANNQEVYDRLGITENNYASGFLFNLRLDAHKGMNQGDITMVISSNPKDMHTYLQTDVITKSDFKKLGLAHDSITAITIAPFSKELGKNPIVFRRGYENHAFLIDLAYSIAGVKVAEEMRVDAKWTPEGYIGAGGIELFREFKKHREIKNMDFPGQYFANIVTNDQDGLLGRVLDSSVAIADQVGDSTIIVTGDSRLGNPQLGLNKVHSIKHTIPMISQDGKANDVDAITYFSYANNSNFNIGKIGAGVIYGAAVRAENSKPAKSGIGGDAGQGGPSAQSPFGVYKK